MLKISLSFFLAIAVLISTAAAQNTNTAIRSNGAVRQARELSNINVAIAEAQPANSTIRGRVYYEDTGRAVKRASLMLIKMESGGPPEYSILTDGSGEFVLRGVKAGTYYAMINAPGVVSPMAYVDLGRLRGNDKEALEDAVVGFEKFVVDGVNEFTFQIPARRGGAVGGRIIYENGDPAIGVRVEILRKLNGKYVPVFSNLSAIFSMFSGSPGTGQTDDRGVYRFAGLPTGEYVVKATENARHTDANNSPSPMAGFEIIFGLSSFLNFYFPDATDIKDAQVLNVVMGQELGEINITIPDKSLFNLSGKVVSIKDKKPISGARITLKRKGDNVVSMFSEIGKNLNAAFTDEEGNWNFKEMPKGDYSVMVEPGTMPSEYGDYSYAANVSTNVNISKPNTPPQPKYAKKTQDLKVEDKDLTDVIVELGFGATIAGTVTTENNKPMPSYVVVSALDENDETLGSKSVTNQEFDDDDGEADVAVRLPQKVNNSFRMENIPAGKVKFRFFVSDDDYYVKSARAGMIDLMTGTVELREGEMLSGVKIVLANDPGTLKGKVVDSKDHAASGVSLLLVPTDAAKKRSPNFFKSARSDSEGKFELKLAPGEYAIVFMKADRIADWKQAEFDAWLDEAMKAAVKVSIDAEKTSTVTVKMPAP